jgi:outer membrane PBP1 activator LpoA protein
MPKRLCVRSFSNQVAISKLLVSSLAAALLLGLSGCSSTPSQTTGKPATTQTQPAALSASKLLQLANQAQSPEREGLVLQAAQVYIDDGKFNRARDLLVDMNADSLPDQAYIKHADLLSAVALQEGSNFLAHGILTKPRLEQQWHAMEPATEIALRDKRAQVFALLGEPQNSVNERIQIAALTSNKKLLQANQDALWQNLMSIPFAELQQLSRSNMSDTARGWYSLAAINKNNQIDLELWLRDWRQHPANKNLPDDLKLLQSLIEQQPKQIALLLPMQGKLAEAGEAVRDGFFAAYFQALGNGRQTPEVRQYDSSNDVITAYQQAIAEGADLVIGPLDKEKVTELSLMPSLEVPLLSLNYPDAPPAQPLKGFYQFGLAVEDEVRHFWKVIAKPW